MYIKKYLSIGIIVTLNYQHFTTANLLFKLTKFTHMKNVYNTYFDIPNIKQIHVRHCQ